MTFREHDDTDEITYGRLPKITRLRPLRHLEADQWWPKDGPPLTPAEMSTEHLLRVIRFNEKRAVAYVRHVAWQEDWAWAQIDDGWGGGGGEIDDELHRLAYKYERHALQANKMNKAAERSRRMLPLIAERIRRYVIELPLMQAFATEVGRRMLWPELYPPIPDGTAFDGDPDLPDAGASWVDQLVERMSDG